MVTTVAFHRIVTSELIIIHIWIALELSSVAVLYGTGCFGPGRAATLMNSFRLSINRGGLSIMRIWNLREIDENESKIDFCILAKTRFQRVKKYGSKIPKTPLTIQI